MPKTVCAVRGIPNKIRERVPCHYAHFINIFSWTYSCKISGLLQGGQLQVTTTVFINGEFSRIWYQLTSGSLLL